MGRKSHDLNGIAANVELGSDGPRIKDSSGVIEARNAADDAYAIQRGADPAGVQDLITKGWLDRTSVVGQIDGGSPPAVGVIGRIYLCTTAGGSYTLKYLYRDTGVAWEEIVPVAAQVIGVEVALAGGTDEYSVNTAYRWDAGGATWVSIGPIPIAVIDGGQA